jgi:hypothetical protein
MVTVHHSGMIPECTRHIINLVPSRSTPSCVMLDARIAQFLAVIIMFAAVAHVT